MRARAAGGFGLDAQWSDDFHHALHAVLTGERDGYYEDFGTGADPGQGAAPGVGATTAATRPHRGRVARPAGRRGLTGDRFVVATQNHDQVGNRAAGERLGRPHDGRPPQGGGRARS